VLRELLMIRIWQRTEIAEDEKQSLTGDACKDEDQGAVDDE
jgi:hypothetical protein